MTAGDEDLVRERHDHVLVLRLNRPESRNALDGPLLEALAVVQPTRQTHLDTGWLTEGSHGGLTVAVFGAVAPTDLPVLRRMQHQAASALAVALDVDAWTGTPPGPGAIQLLAQQGWRAAPVGPRDRLDTVWQELGHTSAQTSRSLSRAVPQVPA